MKNIRSKTAFTLIEMLLALALTGVLLTIVSVTIGAVVRDNHRLESMRLGPNQLEATVEVLRRDLRQSEAYKMTEGVLTLHSHAGVPNSIPGVVNNHDPVEIIYKILSLSETNWFVRQVKAIDAPSTQEPTVELLFGGVTDWSFEMYVEQGSEAIEIPGPRRGISAPLAPPDPPVMSPVTDQVVVSFTLAPSEPRTSSPTPPALESSISSERTLSRDEAIALMQTHVIVVR